MKNQPVDEKAQIIAMVKYAVIMAALFAGLLIGWHYTPVYHHYKNEQREYTRVRMVFNQWMMSQEERDFYMREYKFRPEELIYESIDYSDNGSLGDQIIRVNPVLKLIMGY